MAILGAALGIISVLITKQKFNVQLPLSSFPLLSLFAAVGFLLATVQIWFMPNSALSIPAIVFSLLAAFYLICRGFPSLLKPAAISLLSFCPVIACALLNAAYYFDTSLEMNSPIKVTLQATFLFIMLFFTEEIRFSINRAMPRLYATLAICTLAASSLCSLPVLLSYLFGTTLHLDYALGALASGCICITICYRLFSLFQTSSTISHPTPKEDNTDTNNQQEDDFA